MARIYGRAPDGGRRIEYVKDSRFERITVIDAVGIEAGTAPFMFKGALNTDIFIFYIKNFLLQSWKPSNILVLDNCTPHKSKAAREFMDGNNIQYLYLPAYSPDLNPTELVWPKLKTFLRGAKGGTYDELAESVRLAYENISKKDLQGWFKHCGYKIQNLINA